MREIFRNDHDLEIKTQILKGNTRLPLGMQLANFFQVDIPQKENIFQNMHLNATSMLPPGTKLFAGLGVNLSVANVTITSNLNV
jgi:hypothetical protein